MVPFNVWSNSIYLFNSRGRVPLAGNSLRTEKSHWQVQKMTLAGPKGHTRAKMSHWSVIIKNMSRRIYQPEPIVSANRLTLRLFKRYPWLTSLEQPWCYPYDTSITLYQSCFRSYRTSWYLYLEKSILQLTHRFGIWIAPQQHWCGDAWRISKV